MRYTTWDEVTGRYPSAAKVANAEAAKIEAAYIMPAEGEIDALLGARYIVPFANTPTLAPQIIKDIAIDLAYYRIVWLTLDNDRQKQFRQYLDDRLGGIATGTYAVVSSGGVIVPAGGLAGGWSTQQTHSQVGGMDDVVDWRVSSGELIDEYTRRYW